MDLLVYFEWMESSLLGSIGKTYGGVYAIAQSVHLMSLVVLGGAVILTDLRLLNLTLKDIPSETVVSEAHQWFKVALVSITVTGVLWQRRWPYVCTITNSFGQRCSHYSWVSYLCSL